MVSEFGKEIYLSTYISKKRTYCFFRFCTGLGFYTFAQYIGLVGGNIFLAVALSGIISAIGAMSSAFVITKTGRKTTVGIYQLLTAICFVMLLVVPKDLYVNNWPRLLFAGIGFAGMAVSL